jgi:hypothetical protein
LSQTTSESVIAVHNDGVHESLSTIREKTIQGRSSLPRSTDAIIDVFMSDLQPPPLAIIAQLTKLHLGILARYG